MAARKYNWEEWFGKRLTVVVHGIDYQCSQSTMAQIIRNNASMRGVRVRLIDRGNSFVIEVVSAIPYPDQATVAR